MIFLNEKITGLLFAVLCFLISFISGMMHGAALQVILLRALSLSFVALVVGIIFGIIIRELFIEVILEGERKTVIEQERKRLAKAAAEEASAKKSK